MSLPRHRCITLPSVAMRINSVGAPCVASPAVTDLPEREARWSGLAGVLSVALILGPAVSFFGGDFPAPGDTPAEISRLLHAHRTSYLVGIFCEAISLGVVLWFYAGFRSLIDRTAATAA